MGLIEPYSAIPSWEGYKYQGNVALFVALSKQRDILLNHGSLDGYELQIEGQEDFSILKDGVYKSLHQVKLGKVDLGEEDKFAFIVEVLENGADCGYFHVNPRESIPTDFIDKACSAISNLLMEFQPPIVSKKDLHCGDNPDEYIVLEFVTQNHKKHTKYSLIKNRTDGMNDRISVVEATRTMSNELRQHLTTIDTKKGLFLTSHPGKKEDEMFVKEWPQKFNDSRAIRDQGIQIIKAIIMNLHSDWTFADDKYCGFLYDQGIRLIEQRVTDVFIQGDKNEKCLISFEDIRKQVFWDYYHDFSNVNTEFKYYLLLEKIDNVFSEFRQSECNQNDCAQCKDAQSCNLLKQFKKWSGRGNKEKHQFVFNLLLQEPTFEITEIPNNETIKIQLMELVKDISRLSLNEKNVIAASLNEEIYWLSLDDSRTKETLRKKIQKGLKETTDKSFLYECRTLITSFLKNQEFKVEGSDVTILENEQLKEIETMISSNIDEERENCNKPQTIRLINAEQARGEL